MAQSTQFHFHWAISALLALLLIGTGQYIVAMNSTNPWAGMFMLSLGYLVFAVVAVIAFKLWGAWTESGMMCDNTGHLRPGVFTISWSSTLSFIGEASLILGFYFDPEGVGITSSIVAGTALLSSLFAFTFFKETLNANQIIGILATTFGLVLIAWTSAQDETYLAVISAITALICFSTTNSIYRFVEKAGLDPVLPGILGRFCAGAIGLIFCLVVHLWFFDIFGGDN